MGVTKAIIAALPSALPRPLAAVPSVARAALGETSGALQLWPDEGIARAIA